MGSKRVECLWDAARLGFAIRVTCANRRCGHAVVRDPSPLWTLFVEKGWPGDFAGCGARFRCRRCNHRGARVQPWNELGVEPGLR